MFNFKNSNSGRIKVKLLATLLVITLTFANFALVGSYIGEAIAAEIDLTKQDNSTNNDNVKFELYFAENNSNQISKDINAKDLVLYAKVSVENAGLLENAQIELTDTSFQLQQNEESLNVGTLKAGETKTLELPIEIKNEGDVLNLGLLNMFSKVKLTGVYKNEDNEIDIDSDKYVQVNWTSEAIDSIQDEDTKPIELTQELVTYKEYNVDGTNKKVVQYKITSGIEDNQYPIKSTTIELQTPKYNESTKQLLKNEQLTEGTNGIGPEKVVVATYSLNATNPNETFNFKQYEELSEENTGFSYNQSEGKVKINVVNKENGNNQISWKKGEDIFVVTYIYPEDVTLSALESVVNSKIYLHDLNNRVLSKEDINLEEKSNLLGFDLSQADVNGDGMVTNEDMELVTKKTAGYDVIFNKGDVNSDGKINARDVVAIQKYLIHEEKYGNIINLETNANSSQYKSNMYIGKETLYDTRLTAEISCAGIAESIKITNGSDKL